MLSWEVSGKRLHAELCITSHSNVTSICRLDNVLLIGGIAAGPQEKALKAGVDVVVGTPGETPDSCLKRGLQAHGDAILLSGLKAGHHLARAAR